MWETTVYTAEINKRAFLVMRSEQGRAPIEDDYYGNIFRKQRRYRIMEGHEKLR